MSKLSFLSNPRDWKKVRGEVQIESAGPFRRVHYQCCVSPEHKHLAGRRLLFFSDLHVRPQIAGSHFPGYLSWKGTEQISDFLCETVQKYQPDDLLFGGDMIAFLCNYPEALDLFQKLHIPGKKIGVYGNWDLMRRWFPAAVREQYCRTAGLQLLANERLALSPDLQVCGLEDFRKGSPYYEANQNTPHFECVLVHNPDAVPLAMDIDALRHVNLILCGHTHGGQIRIPFFGAMETSSKFGKTFEYGLYEHRVTGTRMYITAGMGVTFIRKRIFCPPEVLLIEFC